MGGGLRGPQLTSTISEHSVRLSACGNRPTRGTIQFTSLRPEPWTPLPSDPPTLGDTRVRATLFISQGPVLAGVRS